MARLPAPGSVIVPDWHESAEGKEYLACILRKNRRRVFARCRLVQDPLVSRDKPLPYPAVSRGCSSDQCFPRLWPLTPPATRSLCLGRVVWARQRWWPSWLAWRCPWCTTRPLACQEKTDAFLFLFSFTDRASFEDLPGQLARVAGEAPGAVRMVIGSKFDQYMHTDVPERDLTAFRQAWELPLLRVKSVPGRRLADGRTLDGRAGLADIAHVLNGLAEQLWHQDQVAAGLLPNPPEDPPS
ncbi:ciliogenesis and planar polarity effector 2 isoform X2 [Pseudorca crassidens]|uniref:ciliogenesis and planar polarity effector 2 isoform X2 n=1 Tax=Pseudorca crassidens TaxID=82174 RepID=UPI00352D39C3